MEEPLSMAGVTAEALHPMSPELTQCIGHTTMETMEQKNHFSDGREDQQGQSWLLDKPQLLR
jgi:hypothetical protein